MYIQARRITFRQCPERRVSGTFFAFYLNRLTSRFSFRIIVLGELIFQFTPAAVAAELPRVVNLGDFFLRNFSIFRLFFYTKFYFVKKLSKKLSPFKGFLCIYILFQSFCAVLCPLN